MTKFAVAVLCLMPIAAPAQTSAPSTGAASAPAMDRETERVLERAVDSYRKARTYEDKLTVAMKIDAEGDALKAPKPNEFTLAYAAPNRIALHTPQYAVISDGKQLVQQFIPIEQYTVTTAPARINLSELALSEVEAFEGLRQHPIVGVFADPDFAPADFFGTVSRWTGTKREPRDGQAGQLVTGTVHVGGEDHGNQAASGDLPFSAWFSDRDGLLREIVYDHTARVKARIAQLAGEDSTIRVQSYRHVFRFDPVRVNEPIPNERFAFKPPPFHEKVATFELPTPEEFMQKLIGRPAPAFTGKTLDGKTISLGDYRGRVVLLDFWATWCGPCVMSMPQIQKISDRYKNHPVAVLGINGDEPGREQQVSEFVKQNGITYPQLLDHGSSIYQDYRAMTIPHLVLVDAKGIIRAVERGFDPNHPDAIGAEIEQLLKTASQPATGAK